MTSSDNLSQLDESRQPVLNTVSSAINDDWNEIEHWFPMRHHTNEPAILAWNKVGKGIYKSEGTYGIALQDDDLCLDCDPRNYPPSRDVLAEWVAQTKLGPTRAVQTPSNGWHIRYKKPPGIRLRKEQPNFPGIEFRSRNHCVVGPGCYRDQKMNDGRHVQGYYVLKYGGPPLLLPQHVLDALERAPDPLEKGAERYSLLELPKFKGICQAADPAAPNSNNTRGLAAYKLACQARDLNLAPAVAYEVMSLEWDWRNQPPMGESHLWQQVQHGYAYAKNALGCLSAEAVFKPDLITPATTGINGTAPATKEKPASSLSPTVTAAQLRKMEFPPLQWAIKELLPEGLIVFAGAPKVGKSWAALALCHAIATGGKIFGEFKAEQGTAIYFALEDSFRRLQDRLQKLVEEDEKVSENLILATQLPPYGKEAYDYLSKMLDENPDCRIVVIDTMARFTPAPTNKGTSYDFDIKVLTPLQKFALERRIALVLITHTRKAEAPDSMDKIIGSKGITGTADAIWQLERGRGQDGAVLKINGRDVEENDLELKFNKDTCFWEYLGDAEEIQLSKTQENIIACILHLGKPTSPKEVADILSRDKGTTKNLMWKMAQERKIYKTNHGRYFVDTPNLAFKDSAVKIKNNEQPKTADKVRTWADVL